MPEAWSVAAFALAAVWLVAGCAFAWVGGRALNRLYDWLFVLHDD